MSLPAITLGRPPLSLFCDGGFVPSGKLAQKEVQPAPGPCKHATKTAPGKGRAPSLFKELPAGGMKSPPPLSQDLKPRGPRSRPRGPTPKAGALQERECFLCWGRGSRRAPRAASRSCLGETRNPGPGIRSQGGDGGGSSEVCTVGFSSRLWPRGLGCRPDDVGRLGPVELL